MDKLNTTFETICTYAEKIINEVIEIEKQKHNISLRLQILTKKTYEEQNKILDEYLEKLVEEPKQIIKEKEKFIKFILGEPIKNMTFFDKVWKGDMYDVRGIKAFEQLKIDLQSQLENIKVEYIIKELKNK